MKRVLVYIGFLFVLFLLQTAVFRSFLPVAGVSPNFLLVFVLSFALLKGDRTGIVLGFLAGLLIDIVFGDLIGFQALLFMFLGFIAGQFHFSITAGSIFSSLAVILGGDIVYGFTYYVLQFLLRARFHYRFYLLHVILPEAVFTLVVAAVLYPLFFVINEALETDEVRRAKKFV